MMPPRFFCPQPIAAGRPFSLPAAVAHHAVRVLRLGVGDELVLFDGSGGEWFGRIGAIGGASDVRVELDGHDPVSRESLLRTVLVQALLAGDKMDWLVQKAVELGVTRIVPLETERTVVRLSGERATRRVEHLRQVVIAACEQCGRNLVPEVAPLTRMMSFLGAPGGTEEAARLILAPGSPRSLCALDRETRELVLLVGPEGGWSEAELRAAEAARFAAVGLGPRILRAESAGVAALAALQAHAGDFR
jgi:16S rRNA (uracil1498-N3)-methyltransferase